MILEVDAVAIEVEDNILTAHTVIGLATPLIDAINYMTDLLVLIIWLNLLIIERVQVLSQGAHPHLGESFLRPDEYEECLCLSQASKSSSIAYVA